jgi:hypothetical protein
MGDTFSSESEQSYHGELPSSTLAPLPGVKIPQPPSKEGEEEKNLGQVLINRKEGEKLGLQFEEDFSRRATLTPEGCIARSGFLKNGDEIISIDGEVINKGGSDGVEQVIKILGRNSNGAITVRFKPKSGVIPEGVEKVPPPLLPDFCRMVCSTMTSPPPGYKLALQKPVVWATVNSLSSKWMTGATYAGRSDLATGANAGNLLDKCQKQLLTKAHSAGCNAILGLTFNITNDSESLESNGRTAQRRSVIFATMMGTPVVLVPETARVPEL